MNNITMIFDIETSGLPKRMGYNRYFSPKKVEYYNESRIIEIAYIICNTDGTIIKQVSSLIKPDNFMINNSFIHGLTNEICDKDGIIIDNIFKQLYEDIIRNKVSIIVSHNILFDLNILLSECYRYGNNKLYDLLCNKNKKCTMDIGQKYIGMYKLYGSFYFVQLSDFVRAPGVIKFRLRSSE